MMKYILTESQLNFIVESFSIDDLKNRIEYYFKLDKKKYPGADNYQRYVLMKEFQKIVDILFKATKKDFPFDDLKGLQVATVHFWTDNENWNRFQGEPLDTKVNVVMYPVIDESNPIKSKEQFDLDFKKFQEVFDNHVRWRTLNNFFPIIDKIKRDVKVVYTFYDLPVSIFKM